MDKPLPQYGYRSTGSDEVVGVDEGGKLIYSNGHRRCDGVWACPRPSEARDHTPRAIIPDGMRGMRASGCYRSARMINTQWDSNVRDD